MVDLFAVAYLNFISGNVMRTVAMAEVGLRTRGDRRGSSGPQRIMMTILMSGDKRAPASVQVYVSWHINRILLDARL